MLRTMRYLQACKWWAIGLLWAATAGTLPGGELLPNGIELPEVWPPRNGRWTGEPMPVPYLEKRPAVVPIDGERQLFVDDFLVERTTLERTFHRPKYHEASPVLEPETSWERGDDGDWAAPFSDGAWFDPATKRFMLWYRAADRRTCLALSDDGIRWTRPELDVEPGTNVVLTSQNKTSQRDSNTVWLDAAATDPAERFKLFEARYARAPYCMALRTSPDGVHWSAEKAVSARSWDRSTAFYNPFRKVWVASVRGHDNVKPEPTHRLRNYFEGKTAAEAVSWKQETDAVSRGELLPNDLVPWIGADSLDPLHPDPTVSTERPQLYNLDVFPYESLLVGLFTIWQGPTNEVMHERNLQKRNEVFVGYSRDGFHWHRPDRTAFLPVSDDAKAWNAANVQSCGGGCVTVGDELYFYCSGRRMQSKNVVSTGLATMRRDGFASLDVPDESTAGGGGELVTRPIRFDGSALYVNAAPGKGTLRVEVLDLDGKVIRGYSRDDCEPIDGDEPSAAIHWKDGRDLTPLADRTVRFRFLLTDGALYSFWIVTR